MAFAYTEVDRFPVDLLRPVLNDKQLETYRNELKTKGLGFYGQAFGGSTEETIEIK